MSKFNATGSALIYSTYLGGTLDDAGNGIAVDTSGNAYVAGYTLSTNFITTTSVLQLTNGGGRDAFVSQLNAAGSALTYSTFLGGTSTDSADAIAVDTSGNAYVTGRTQSTNFITTTSALQLNNSGGGGDAFVTKLNSSGSTATYSTFLGGSGQDEGFGIALDSSGNAYVTGQAGTGFPTVSPIQATGYGGSTDAFLSKVNTGATALVYSTYLGGSNTDVGNGIAVDGSGNAFLTGSTKSSNFTTTSPIQGSLSGTQDAFVTEANAAGSAWGYSTYLGARPWMAAMALPWMRWATHL